MISYDDLVARLHSWRARQGLPVSAVPAAPAQAAPAADVYSEEHVELLDEEHDDLPLSSIDSDEATPIGGLPESPRRF